MRILNALPVAALAVAAVAIPATASAEPCRATSSDLQALRDNLEIVRTQLAGAKDNFGPGRIQALDATSHAIEAFERNIDHAVTPSAESLILRTPGRARHPRMMIAQQALEAAHRGYERARCLLADRGESVRGALAAVDAAIADALNTNAPGNGG